MCLSWIPTYQRSISEKASAAQQAKAGCNVFPRLLLLLYEKVVDYNDDTIHNPD